MKKIAIFGSTGSIGKSLINIVKKNKKNFKIELLTTNKNYKELIKQIKIFKTKNVIITDKKSFIIVKKILINKNINVYNNFNNLNKIFKNKKIDYTMCAISGFEGLRPTIDVIKFTKVIAIANKESIICGWNLIKKKLHKYKTKFIPIDSEHFSIWSLIGESKNINFEKIYLTASGGPFRTYPLNQFKNITPKEALKHPNWLMGKKISIDSATMMNKVFEIIEAKKIFDLDYKQLQILIHPQSYLHAIVKFNNGLTKFLVHDTNMTIPIFNSINFDNRKILLSKPLNLKILNNLSLENVNKIRFPLVKVIDKLTNFDSLFDTVVVCANDLLVSKFLNGDIKFIDISKILLKILSLKEFKKYKKIQPKKINDIQIISKLVSLKIASLGV
tara:strand:+ start:1292 stop:2455 length:1164 start_codon:yes stop_codon:yes gene_type:complete